MKKITTAEKFTNNSWLKAISKNLTLVQLQTQQVTS